MRPSDLPPAEKYPHGTRARYVTGCHCSKCREANRELYHKRQKEGIELASQITTQGGPSPQVWTTPSGEKKVRIYARACPGVHDKPCERSSHLRKDSKGGVCRHCRLKLAWNGLVDAAPARAHIHTLSRRHVGYKTVADAACVATSIVAKICSGRKKRIRASTEKKILEVDIGAIADHSFVPANETWELLKKLKQKGYTKTELAERLGYKAKIPALQYDKRKVLAKTAAKVRRLYRDIMLELDLERRTKKLCIDCCFSHSKEDRFEFLRRHLPTRVEVLRNLWPCAYGNNKGERSIYRDLRAIGATSNNSIWSI